jgi:hypothetical protein
MWQGCDAGNTGDQCATGGATHYDWQAAIDYCDGLSWGGYSDWRLPDIDTLKTILDSTAAYPAIDQAAFPATKSYRFWSSSSSTDDPSSAWVVDFNVFGSVTTVTKNTQITSDYIYVRCVRGP